MTSHAITQAIDSVGFSGTGSDGGAAIALRLSRRHERRAEVLVLLRIDGVDYFLPGRPDHFDDRSSDSGDTFRAAGLAFEVLEPLVRWRVTFDGALRKRLRPGDPADDVHVRFSFVCKPIHRLVALPYDVDTGELTQAMITRWRHGGNFRDLVATFNRLERMEERCEQFSQLHGTLALGRDPPRVVKFRGLKERTHGSCDWASLHSAVSIRGITQMGVAFHFRHERSKTSEFRFGYIIPACDSIVDHVTRWPSPEVVSLVHNRKFSLTFRAGNRDHDLECEMEDDHFRSRGNVRLFRFTLDGVAGSGFVETASEPDQRTLPVLSLEDRKCRSKDISGGKGSSLAVMAMASNVPRFVVPPGVCVTTSAYLDHLDGHAHLRRAVEDLAARASVDSPILQEACQRTVALWERTSVSQPLREHLGRALGSGCETERYAVRSSATNGEDDDDASGAGQHETFLGLAGLEEVCAAIVRCWASQFSFRSVQYKRATGKPLLGTGSAMAVIVQTMVDADVSGILFTCDPVTGSDDVMVLSANYGLPDSVVSGEVDCDKIVLKRHQRHLTVHEKRIGTKHFRVTMSSSGGTEEVPVPQELQQRCSVTDQVALRLGDVALYLLKQQNGASRKCYHQLDIEWASRGDTIFLLQSRPVTAAPPPSMSDFDVVHEFDTTLLTEHEQHTIANVSEVLPGYVTPLTCSSIFRLYNVKLEELARCGGATGRLDDPTVDNVLEFFYGHYFSNRIKENFRCSSVEKSAASKAAEVAMHGRLLDDDGNVRHLAMNRNGRAPSWWSSCVDFYFLKRFVLSGVTTQLAHRRFRKYRVLAGHEATAAEVLAAIESKLADNMAALQAHDEASKGSALWNMHLLNLLAATSGGDSCRHVAALVGGGTESATVPSAITELASVISEEADPERFRSMPAREALRWIKGNGRCRRHLEAFLKRHGHRCYKEFDLASASWDMQPEELVGALQVKMGNGGGSGGDDDDDTRTILSGHGILASMLLRFVVWRTGVATCNRELTKSLLIRVVDGFRKAYRRLARLLVADGALPDEELAFYFTHAELRQLVASASATKRKLVARAQHRQRVRPLVEKLHFPEMSSGLPVPVGDDDDDGPEASSATIVHGCVVSRGRAEGTAKVVVDYDDLVNVRPGDILVTRILDIAWSAFFPALAGVVTETGGLISHGAVIAREFGVPCIIRAGNATRIFRTGDRVRLDATRGYIERIDQR